MIDPSIPLGVKPVNFGENMMQGAERGMNLRALAMKPEQIQAEIAASRQSTANLAAQEPGIRADSEVKERAAAFNRWQTENSKRFVTGEGANRKFDHKTFVTAASEAGFTKEAQAVASTDLDNDSKKIGNETSLVTKAEKVQDWQKKALGYASQLVMNAPEEQRPAMWKQYADYSEGLVPGTGALFGNYDPLKTEAMRKATMTPEQQTRLEAGLESTGQDPQSRDPNSAISRAAFNQFKQANPDYTGPTLSLTDIRTRFPEFAEQIGRGDVGARIGAPERIEAEKTTNEYITAQNVLNRGAKAGAAAMNSPAGKTYIGERIGDLFSKYVESDPNIKVFQDAVLEYEKTTGKKLDPTLSLQGAIRVIEAGASDLTKKITAGKKVSATSKLTPGVAPGETPAAGKVRVRSPDGKVGMIPAARLKEYEANGFTRE